MRVFLREANKFKWNVLCMLSIVHTQSTMSTQEEKNVNAQTACHVDLNTLLNKANDLCINQDLISCYTY